MANYIIIGGDGKEYGPVTDADVRQWIAEGRLNALSQAKGEGDAEFRPLAQFPEFADAFRPATIGSLASPAAGASAELNDGDYDLDIGHCVSRGWSVFKENLGILLGAFVLYMVLTFVASIAVGAVLGALPGMMSGVGLVVRSVVQPLLLALVVGPLSGGYYILSLKALRGERPGIEDLFAGFQRAFAGLFLGSAVIQLIASLCILPVTIMTSARLGPLLEKMQQHPSSDPTASMDQLREMMNIYQSILPVLLACLIPILFVQVTLTFTLPLIADRGLSVGTALTTGARAVLRHWFHVFGLVVVVGLLGVAGVVACCVGALFTLPWGMLAMMVAYESIFLRKKA